METIGPKPFGTAARKTFIDQVDSQNPGPGAHSPNRFDNIQNPQWSVTLSKERNSFADPYKVQYPSPDQYKPNFSSIQTRSHEFSIPKAGVNKKLSEVFHHIYHPDIGKIKIQTPSYSLGHSIETEYANKIPGVGTYSIQVEKKNINKTQNLFGTAERPLPYGQEQFFPGPGQYLKQKKKTSQQYSFPKSSKTNSKKKDKEPLAKFYDVSSKPKVSKGIRLVYSQKDKTKEAALFHSNQNPAPNKYDIIHNRHIPNGVFQYSKRRNLYENQSLKFPSPQKYSGEVIIKTKKGFSFSKKIRDLSVTNNLVPAPGTYQLQKTLNTNGGAIGKQQGKTYDNFCPSSTDYRPKVTLTKQRACSTIVFRGNRTDFSKTITGSIGPGSYQELTDNHKELGKIGNSSRQLPFTPNKNPGVGNYNLPNYFGKLPKYYTLPKKLDEKGYSTYQEKVQKKNRQIPHDKSENNSTFFRYREN